MKPDDKNKSKDTSSWGIFFSIALHVTVLVLVLFWGFSGSSKNDSLGPIEVSLSNLPPGGGQGSGEPARPRRVEPPPPPAPEPPKAREEVVKEPPPPPEPEKVEVKKEEPEPVVEEKVVKKEPEPEPEKKAIPLEPEKEPEKKVVKKPEPTPEPKKEVKKEVAKKPEPTEKPKAPEKKTASKSKDLESEKSKVLQDIKRQRVLENLKKGSEESEQPVEPMGEEQRLAMADSGSESEDTFGDSPPEGPGTASERPGGGSGVNTALLGIYTNQVHQRIKRNWRIPPGVPTDGDLSTGVFFRVDSSGRVLDVRVNKSSGNPAFDQYCVDAIRKASPLPPPPSEFAKAAEREGMDITFYNETF